MRVNTGRWALSYRAWSATWSPSAIDWTSALQSCSGTRALDLAYSTSPNVAGDFCVRSLDMRENSPILQIPCRSVKLLGAMRKRDPDHPVKVVLQRTEGNYALNQVDDR